jgi:hypothetical protein
MVSAAVVPPVNQEQVPRRMGHLRAFLVMQVLTDGGMVRRMAMRSQTARAVHDCRNGR